MTVGHKLVLAGAAMAALTGYMAYVGASSSWQYYLTTEECLAQSDRVEGARLRVSGQIAAGTLQIAADRRQTQFSFQCPDGQLLVECRGQLPDQVKEGMDVVVEGRLENGALHGDKLLTRCASKYKSQGTAAENATAGRDSRRR